MDREIIAVTTAEIRNKLQAPKAALEMLSEGKIVKKKFIEMALEEINKIVDLLTKIGKGKGGQYP